MVKLITFYKTPENTHAFDSHFTTIQLRRVKKLPGLRKIEIARVTGTTIEGGPEFERKNSCLLFAGQDQKEGIRACVEKRKADRKEE